MLCEKGFKCISNKADPAESRQTDQGQNILLSFSALKKDQSTWGLVNSNTKWIL